MQTVTNSGKALTNAHLTWVALLCAAVFANCSGGDDGGDERVLVEFDNTGRVCLFADSDSFSADPQDFASSQPVTVEVMLEECLSSSCTEDRTTACQATVDGATISITSSGSYVDVSGDGRECTADCLLLAARCEVSGLPDGDYTFEHGGATISLTIPSTQPSAPCN